MYIRMDYLFLTIYSAGTQTQANSGYAECQNFKTLLPCYNNYIIKIHAAWYVCVYRADSSVFGISVLLIRIIAFWHIAELLFLYAVAVTWLYVVWLARFIFQMFCVSSAGRMGAFFAGTFRIMRAYDGYKENRVFVWCPWIIRLSYRGYRVGALVNNRRVEGYDASDLQIGYLHKKSSSEDDWLYCWCYTLCCYTPA